MRNRFKKHPPSERFWQKVAKSPEVDGCWEWTGCRHESGHGRFWDGNRVISAHWFLLPRYPNTEFEEACHHCDNPPCVRPDHIYIGTPLSNVRDAIRRGRYHFNPKGIRTRITPLDGELNPNSKLTEDQAASIRFSTNSRRINSKIAAHFGITKEQVSFIRRGISWPNIMKTEERVEMGIKLSEEMGKIKKFLDDEDVKYIKSSHLMGTELAKMFGVSKASISRIKTGKMWRQIT